MGALTRSATGGFQADSRLVLAALVTHGGLAMERLHHRKKRGGNHTGRRAVACRAADRFIPLFHVAELNKPAAVFAFKFVEGQKVGSEGKS